MANVYCFFSGKERSKYYTYQLFLEEKVGINESLMSIIQRFKSSTSVSCQFLIRICLHKLQKSKETKYTKRKVYYLFKTPFIEW